MTTAPTPPIQWEWHETAKQWDASYRSWLLIVYRTDVFHFVADHYDYMTDRRRQIRGEAQSLRAAQAAVIAAVNAAEEAKSI